MVRRRRITTACFLDVIRAPCGARSGRDMEGRYCSAARARGDGRAWRHRPAHGVEANEVTGGAAQLPVPA